MTDSAFEALADSLLTSLEAALADHTDAELQGSSVLNVETDDGTWVVNKHAPTRQIWLSSPRSGARHFAYDLAARAWKDTRGGADLLTVLSGELGVPLTWEPQ